MKKIEIIKEKMNKLKKADKKFDVFGANFHKYKINKKLKERELIDFEKLNDLKIPEDYRQFLTSIGNGGFGPFYGLLPLLGNDGNKVHPEKEFTLTKEKPLKIYEELKPLEIRLEKCNNKMEEKEIYEEKDRKLDSLYEKATCGITFLCHEGCGMYSVLVIKGQEAGNVWYLDFANDVGAYPLINPKTQQPVNFSDWLEMWLDKSIEEMENGKHEIWGYANHVVD